VTFSDKNITHFLRYALAGGMAFVCEYSTFLALYYGAHRSVIVANSTSFLVGLLISFLLNRQWVFRHGSRGVSWQFGLFVSLATFNLVLTSLILLILRHYGVAPAVGKLGVMALVVSWNFIILRNHIFKRAAPVSF
jgi:putative flippase GtrA